jgi:hypothetical protein
MTMAIRTLTAPAIAVAAMPLAVRSGAIEHPKGITDAALIAYYWATLGFTAARLCTLIARITPTLTMPTTRRLSAALLLIGTGLALATGQSLLTIARTPPQTSSLAVTLALGLLSAATINAGRDLREAKP